MLILSASTFISFNYFMKKLTIMIKNLREGKGREGKGREGKGREGKGREGKGRENKGRENKKF